MAPTRTKPSCSQSTKRRSKWKVRLQAWVPDPEYRIPGGIDENTICSANQAKSLYDLDERDLKAIPHQVDHDRKLYPLKEVEYLSLVKKKYLESEGGESNEGEATSEKPSASQSTSPQKKKRFSKKSAGPSLPAWQQHTNFPQPPPMIIHGPYKRLYEVEFPDPKDLDLKSGKIQGSVSVKDACRLFALREEDIQDLIKKSPWIDQTSAKKRALSLHGGFANHRNIISRMRKKEEERLESENKERSDFEWSAIVQEQLDWFDRGNETGIPRWRQTPATDGPSLQNRVAVLYPIQRYRVRDSWKWLPARNDF